ncbi:nicotinamide-nucleotide amidase [Vibrio fluminensis]|uniref:nicotinamide-nucleotide amidase n=1 Tax=Vibrio fluminensis TaxID=2783614 RepID=UPI001888EDDA|nr:nicotinamide-nucleotide amidase [Vibrio fluminensis]
MESHQILSVELGKLLQQRHQTLATAESCTGGGISAAVTDIAGSSAWFDRTFVTYSNEAKMEMLGVQAKTLETHGAVSEPVVIEMVQGTLTNSNATIAVSVSGIAGPGGGTPDKPVGTVCFCFTDNTGWLKVTTEHFSGDRAGVREQAVEFALKTLCDYLGERS